MPLGRDQAWKAPQDTSDVEGSRDISEQDFAERALDEVCATMSFSNWRVRLWVAALLTIWAAALVAYATQLRYGLEVTAMRDYVSWGVYMVNFVFFIGVSHAGTLISAILRVTNAEWRRPITRMAEAITVFALMIGAPMVMIDMGRPDRVHHVFLYGRMNSPILWDICSITTYVTGSLLYLYVAMIPDLALLRSWAERTQPGSFRAWLYRRMAIGYRGTPAQKRYLNRALATMAVIIIPVAISVHTVVSWIFGMTLRPGWHSTIFGPYFVVGAIFSGTAGIITAMAVFRWVYGLERYLTHRHFRNLGTLLLVLDLLYLYFTLSEYLTAWYGSEMVDRRLIDLLMGPGSFGVAFWTMAAVGLLLPVILLAIPTRKSIAPIVIASLLVNIGMWLKRYLIIIPTLETPYIPAKAAGLTPQYFPTLVEWMITAGAFAFFMLLFTLFSKLFPIISVWETIEGVEELGAERVGVEIGRAANERNKRRGSWVGTTVPGPIVPLLVIGVVLLAATGVRAGVAGEGSDRAEITITTEAKNGAQVLVGTVVRNGAPLPGITVALYAKRTFGLLPLGQGETDSAGAVAVPFPKGLPAGRTGELEVLAQVVSPEDYRALEGHAIVPGGRIIPAVADPFPRALWEPHAPLTLILTIVLLLSGVWCTYTFVVIQLMKIRRDTASATATRHPLRPSSIRSTRHALRPSSIRSSERRW